MKIDVLDHGFVRLVDYMGNDLSVVRAARVSYDAAWRTGNIKDSDERLIHYLWTHHHSTPFEAVEFQFEIKAPIFVLRQWMRHRTWSYNEVSARYTELPNEFYVPKLDNIGVQDPKNKQGRVTASEEKSLLSARSAELNSYIYHCRNAIAEYNHLLSVAWPRELARCVLPVSTYSHMFAKVNLWNLLHFLTLRCDKHAQYEIRVYAEAIVELIRSIVPVCIESWRE